MNGWMISMIIGIKLLSTFISGVIPSTLLSPTSGQRSSTLNEYVVNTYEYALETADLYVILIIQLYLMIIYNHGFVLHRRIAFVCLFSVTIIGTLLIISPVHEFYTVFIIAFIWSGSIWYLQQIVLYVSIVHGEGLAR